MLQAALVLARLRSHLGRSLVLVVAVGVAAGIALSALAVLRVADDPWAPLHAATLGGDVEIDAAPARPDPRALAATLPEVATMGPLIQSGDAALQVHGQVLLVSLKRMPADREAMVVERPLLMAGRWFAAGDEVVFEATLADTLGIEVGDMVVLNGEHGRTVRVVGTAATTMQPNYPERLPGSVFAGGALFDAIGPVGPPQWSMALRLHDPSQADAVVAPPQRQRARSARQLHRRGLVREDRGRHPRQRLPLQDRGVRGGDAVLRGADADRGGAADRHLPASWSPAWSRRASPSPPRPCSGRCPPGCRLATSWS